MEFSYFEKAFKFLLHALKESLYWPDFPPDPTETTINSVLIAIQCVCLSILTVNRTLFITGFSKIGLHRSLSADWVLLFVLLLNPNRPEPAIMTPDHRGDFRVPFLSSLIYFHAPSLFTVALWEPTEPAASLTTHFVLLLAF